MKNFWESIKKNIDKHSFQIVVYVETIILFLLIVIPLEYLLTERFLICKNIDDKLRTNLFFAIFSLIFFLNFFWKRFFIIGKFFLRILSILFIIVLLCNNLYSTYYKYLQKYPKIFSVTPNWAIQGMTISIDGRNFGPEWQNGKVLVDDIKLEIKSWSDSKIVTVFPVPTKFGVKNLKVVRADNYESNKVNFEIRDPNNL